MKNTRSDPYKELLMSWSCVEVGVSISLLLFAHRPNHDCLEEISSKLAMSNPYTNYFFKCPQGDVGLVVVGHEIVRVLHTQLVSSGNMPYHIYFGYNTDPVEVIPLRHILEVGISKTSPKY